MDIPNIKTRRWTGPYLGNYYGDIYRTFNVDLDNSPGHITLSRRFVRIADTSDSNTLTLQVVNAFIRTDADQTDRYWGLSGSGALIKTQSGSPLDLTSVGWVSDPIASSPTDARDMTIHENDTNDDSGHNRLMVTRDTDIAVLNDTAAATWNVNWWVSTKGQTGLKTGVPHPIEYFPYRRISLVGDGNQVHTIDKLSAVSYGRLILPNNYQVEHIFVTPFRAWILCSGKFGQNGAIVEWDGYSETYNYIHDVQSSFPLTGVNYNGVPFVINNRGLILEYNGSSFGTMTRNGQKITLPFYEENGNSFSGNGSIARRGMTVTDDGLIYINMQAPPFASKKQLGGIWCLDPIRGQLYLKHALSFSTDFGNQSDYTPGAVKAVNPTSSLSSSSYLLAGGNINTNLGTVTNNCIWAIHRVFNSVVLQRGHFITQLIPASKIQDFWDTIWTRISAFKSANDLIIVKAKGINSLTNSSKNPLESIITWTSTTTFTVTASAGDDPFAVGDEIEVLSGKNDGLLAHITQISGAQFALQTVTIDEVANNNSGLARCRFDRWKKLGVINDSSKYAVALKIGITSTFIQFKLELRGLPADFDVKSLVINPVIQTKEQK